MAARKRTSIRLANGRLVWGYLPGQSRKGARYTPVSEFFQYLEVDSIQEYQVRDELARQLGGIVEGNAVHGKTILGFADVVTRERAFEVETYQYWRDGVRQAMQYAVQFNLVPALALFRVIRQQKMLDIYNEVREIELPGLRAGSSVELWWWAGSRWEHITSPAQCSDMPRGIRFGHCSYCGDPVAWHGDSDISYSARWDPMEMHCCAQLCEAEHRGVKGCQYWLMERASSPAQPE